jgi:hypothetical protein
MPENLPEPSRSDRGKDETAVEIVTGTDGSFWPVERPSGPGNDRPEMVRTMERSARERLTTELGTSGIYSFLMGVVPVQAARRGAA